MGDSNSNNNKTCKTNISEKIEIEFSHLYYKCVNKSQRSCNLKGVTLKDHNAM